MTGQTDRRTARRTPRHRPRTSHGSAAVAVLTRRAVKSLPRPPPPPRRRRTDFELIARVNGRMDGRVKVRRERVEMERRGSKEELIARKTTRTMRAERRSAAEMPGPCRAAGADGDDDDVVASPATRRPRCSPSSTPSATHASINNNNNLPRQCLLCYHHDQSHCESSPGSFDECRLSAGWPLTLRPSRLTWDVSPPKTGSYRPHPPSPLLLLLSP